VLRLEEVHRIHPEVRHPEVHRIHPAVRRPEEVRRIRRPAGIRPQGVRIHQRRELAPDSCVLSLLGSNVLC